MQASVFAYYRSYYNCCRAHLAVGVFRALITVAGVCALFLLTFSVVQDQFWQWNGRPTTPLWVAPLHARLSIQKLLILHAGVACCSGISGTLTCVIDTKDQMQTRTQIVQHYARKLPPSVNSLKPWGKWHMQRHRHQADKLLMASIWLCQLPGQWAPAAVLSEQLLSSGWSVSNCLKMAGHKRILA